MNTGVQKNRLGHWAWLPRAVARGGKGCDDFNGGEPNPTATTPAPALRLLHWWVYGHEKRRM